MSYKERKKLIYTSVSYHLKLYFISQIRHYIQIDDDLLQIINLLTSVKKYALQNMPKKMLKQKLRPNSKK